jgi:hypothetical protein
MEKANKAGSEREGRADRRRVLLMLRGSRKQFDLSVAYLEEVNYNLQPWSFIRRASE